MNETVSVSISGIAFSFISYENVKCDSNQEGFLLGDLIRKETNQVTDAEHRVINKQNIIKIKSIIPCPHQFYFYDASGKINTEKINTLLASQKDRVVGWYLFKHKHASSQKLTLREKIIHKRLAELLSLPVAYFTTCLLTVKNSNTNATYSFSQTFLRYHMSKYESLPLHVANLTVPNYTFKSAEPMPNVLMKVVEKVKTLNKSDGRLFIQQIQEGLQSHMNTLLEKSVEKEEQLFKLEEEIKHLKQRLMLGREYGNSTNNVNENGLLECESQSIEKIQTSEEVPETNRRRKNKQQKNATLQIKYNTRNSPSVSSVTSDSSKENLSYSSITKRKNVEKQ